LGVAYYLSSRFDWPMLIQLNFVLISIAFSAFIGVTFGLYPAHKASRLDPIRALRYE
jgi:putative ABC transport system permease protein